MSELIQIILEWPIIVQGALGSALFWGVLVTGQKITSLITDKVSLHSKKSRERNLRIERYKYLIIQNKDIDRPSYFIALIYVAMKRMLKGLLLLTLGMASESIIPVFGIIGYLGAMYFFFLSLKVFKPLDQGVDVDARLQEINNELNENNETYKKIRAKS